MAGRDRILECFLGQPGGQPATVAPDGTVWTFDEVLGRALAVAQQLRARAQVGGRVVLVRAGPTPLFSVTDLAVLLAGGVPSALPDLTGQQLAAVWRVLDPAAVIDTTTGAESDPLNDAVWQTRTPLLRVGEASCRPTGTVVQWRAVARRWSAARLEQAASVVFTSGTTGTPRSVVLADTALVRGVRAWNAQWNHRPERTLAYLPVSHVAQRIMGHTLMCLYGTTVVASHPDRVAADLVAHRPDTLLGVPHAWARLAAAAAQDADLRAALSGVRVAVNGAAALDRTVAAELKQYAGLRIMGAYGATETTTPVFHSHDASLPGLGQPVGVDFHLTAEGELQLRGPNLATGYVDCWPHLRPVTGRDGWLRTGDLVRVDGDGQIQLVGRLASSFKTSRGEMISPEAVEAHLLTHPDVTAACLLGPGLPRAVALVCAPRSAAWSPQRIAAFENALLMRAEEARRHGEVPWSDLAAVRVLSDSWRDLALVTSTGKPRRSAIAERYLHLLTLPERARVPA
ncbi:class I adenylate-forming enzyme family protein [Streptomyces sp. B29(2018)]|uniref:class I adenylate-forming enzyme family protein n=1 Tax=Streptomyces sp. B29(2018) TaxID=2485016 RepID=UPI000FD6514C|nr:AMP-binding protein [Streptomyces sp. B29(2018)]